MRGDQTVYVLKAAEEDWQGDPIDEPERVLVATDCAFIPKTNTDDGSLVAGEGMLVVFPDAENVPEPDDEVEIGSRGIWQIDGDVAEFTKGGTTRSWMMNVRKQR